MKKIATTEWLLLALAVLLAKFFFLPDSPAIIAGSSIVAGACGLGALAALHRPATTAE